MVEIIAFDINILEIYFSPKLGSVIPSIFTLESREHNIFSNRFRFLDKLLMLQ